MQTKRNAWVILVLAALLTSGPIGCSKKEGIGERTGKTLDKAAAEVEDGAKKAGEAMKKGAKEVGEAVEEGAEEAEKAIDDLTD